MAALELVSSSDLGSLRESMVSEDEQRESLIKRSREVLKLSKNAIYALHRGEVAKAGEMVASATELAKRDLLPLVTTAPALRTGALSAALEELAEASVFAGFLATGRIPTMAECAGGIVNRDEYLGGLMDFSGELNRYAVLRATVRDVPGVVRCRDVVDALFAQLMLFEWRNGQLRRKFDALKYTVKKLEQIIYELSMSAAGGIVVPKGSSEPEPMMEEGNGGQGGEGGETGGGGEEGAGGAGGEEGHGHGGGGGRGGRGGKRGRF